MSDLTPEQRAEWKALARADAPGGWSRIAVRALLAALEAAERSAAEARAHAKAFAHAADTEKAETKYWRAESSALRERVSALDTARRKAEVLLAGQTIRAENAERALLSALTTAEFLYGIASGEIRVIENHRTLEARQTLDRLRAFVPAPGSDPGATT